MDRFDAIRLFTRIVERRSFTQAAQDLGLPRSTVTEAIRQLEARLGVRLLQRTTRVVSPTLDGEAYYHRCLAILADIEDAEAAFGDPKPRGLLRIDVHGTLARHFLLPGLADFLERYPGLQLHIGEGDRLVDLVREGIDCVIRAGDLQDSSMVARRVALLAEATCASPAYLARHGVPATPDDLEGHRMVGFLSSATGSVMPLEFQVDAAIRHVDLPTALTVTGSEALFGGALAGLGLIQVPRYHLLPYFADGTLIEVLPAHPPTPTPVSLLYPQNRQLSPRVRVFIDWVTRRFAESSESGEIRRSSLPR
ncbi:LysR family transcriptional regulator [Labrys sp. KNU-23]|uniref:LysR family transcriptional regulator n=1 Tax=Labrys sp. KNU-23 TaxID=2789216 RepID=UPI0011ED39A6|nr:LysR family transcriptional regulator [Labrys sp. KNU-23]QEN87300.1 LysR family transcriptional regulator [Labrys sp. KNU-23]